MIGSLNVSQIEGLHIRGKIEKYNVSRNSEKISKGDFVKFIEEAVGEKYIRNAKAGTTIQLCSSGMHITPYLVKFDNTHLFFSYSTSTNILLNDINAIFLTLSKGELTASNRINIINTGSSSVSYDGGLAKFDEKRVLISYCDSSQYISIINIDEQNAISKGKTIYVGSGSQNSLIKLLNDKILICANNKYGFCTISDKDEVTINLVQDYQFVINFKTSNFIQLSENICLYLHMSSQDLKIAAFRLNTIDESSVFDKITDTLVAQTIKGNVAGAKIDENRILISYYREETKTIYTKIIEVNEECEITAKEERVINSGNDSEYPYGGISFMSCADNGKTFLIYSNYYKSSTSNHFYIKGWSCFLPDNDQIQLTKTIDIWNPNYAFSENCGMPLNIDTDIFVYYDNQYSTNYIKAIPITLSTEASGELAYTETRATKLTQSEDTKTGIAKTSGKVEENIEVYLPK